MGCKYELNCKWFSGEWERAGTWKCKHPKIILDSKVWDCDECMYWELKKED